MEDPFQSLLEDVTPRTVLREQLDALRPVDTPAPIRRAVSGKRRSERIEKNALKRMKDENDGNLATKVHGHQSQQSQKFSASDLGVSLNVSITKGVDRTYAELSALDSGESSINESIDLDLEAAARFRKKKRSVEYLTQPEVSVSKIAKQPPKASSAKKTLQKANKSSLPSNVRTSKSHIEVNVSTNKTYTNINTSVMESSSDSIDFGAAKNMRHPKKKGIVFPQIDAVVPTSQLLKGDSYTDSTNLEVAKDMYHQPKKQGIVLNEPEPVLSTSKSPQVNSTLNSSQTYSLRSRLSNAPKWKSPHMFQSALKDSAQKWKTFSNEKSTTSTDDQVSHLDKTYESLVDNEDSFDNVQLKTKQRFPRKASALKLNLSELIKDLRAENESSAVLEESQTENEVSDRQGNKNLREKNSSFAVVEESQTHNEAVSERQANEKEITPKTLKTASETQLSPVAGTRDSIAHQTTSVVQSSPVREEDSLPERALAEDEGILISQTQKSWSDAPVKTLDEGHVLSMVHKAPDNSEYKLNDPIPPPVRFRDVNDDDIILKSQSASFSIGGEDPDNQKMLSSFSSGSGDDSELGDHISAALISLDSEGENNSVLGSSENRNHVHSPQPPSHTQDRPKSVEKEAILSLSESPVNVGKNLVSEGEDVPQSPRSVGKDHVSEGKDVPQSPISVTKDLVSEGEDVPQSPISVGKDLVSEGEDVPPSPISFRKDHVSEGKDVPQSPISVTKDLISEGEDVPQSPISVGKDPVSEGEDVPQSPVSEGEDVPQSPISVGIDPVSEDEDVPQSPISLGKDPVSEGENVPQSPTGVRKGPVHEGEDVSHFIQDPVSGKDAAHAVQEDRLSDDDYDMNLLPVTVSKTVQVLPDTPAEDGILVDTEGMSYQVTVEGVGDKASDDTGTEKTPPVPSQGEQSKGDDSASKSVANTSVQKLASQPGSSKTKQMTMKDFLQKLTSKPVQPPALADEGRPRPWLGDLLGDKRTSLAKETSQQAGPTKKTEQTGKKPLPPSLPKGITREIFSHFAKCKLSSDGMNEIMKTSEKYWKNLSFDLVNFMSARRGSSDIIAKDVRKVMARQGLISSDFSFFALVEEYLPMEEWNTLIPTAFAKDNVYPKDRAGGRIF